MAKVIWVKGGLINNERLAEFIDHLPEQQCTLKRVNTVQEAIIELYESTEQIALIICDSVLDMSTPVYQLESMAMKRDIAFFTADNDAVYASHPVRRRPNMFKTQSLNRSVIGFVSDVMKKLDVKEPDGVETSVHNLCGDSCELQTAH